MVVMLPLTTTLEAGQEDLNSKIHSQPQKSSCAWHLSGSPQDRHGTTFSTQYQPTCSVQTSPLHKSGKTWLGITGWSIGHSSSKRPIRWYHKYQKGHTRKGLWSGSVNKMLLSLLTGSQLNTNEIEKSRRRQQGASLVWKTGTKILPKDKGGWRSSHRSFQQHKCPKIMPTHTLYPL